MRTAAYRVALLLAFVPATGSTLQTTVAANSYTQAISGTVSGHVQAVGFRAMILKQAIEYNLAGSAKNNQDGTVQFILQGDKNRIDEAVEAVRNGTTKSSDVNVSVSPAAVDSSLNNFTVLGWTSTSRNITHPYDLVFNLRPEDNTISKKEAKEVWHAILRSTLKGEDLSKLRDDD
jgi:acylphosphatase